jgi:hypothetical protein
MRRMVEETSVRQTPPDSRRSPTSPQAGEELRGGRSADIAALEPLGMALEPVGQGEQLVAATQVELLLVGDRPQPRCDRAKIRRLGRG